MLAALSLFSAYSQDFAVSSAKHRHPQTPRHHKQAWTRPRIRKRVFAKQCQLGSEITQIEMIKFQSSLWQPMRTDQLQYVTWCGRAARG